MSVERKNYSNSRFEFKLPNLLSVQTDSFEQFLQKNVPSSQRRKAGLEQVFREIFPIQEAKGRCSLEFEGYSLGEPRYTFSECREKGLTYAAPLTAQIKLTRYEEGAPIGSDEESKVSDTITEEVNFGDMPLMTESGSFLISGAERVVVSQLHRSPGVSFDAESADNKQTFRSRIIPQRGSWVDLFTEPSDILYISIDRRKKIPVTVLLRALGFARNEDILALYYTSKTIRVADITEEEIQNGKYILFADCIDQQTGELLVTANSVLEHENVRKMLDAGIETIKVIGEPVNDDPIIHKTLAADPYSKENITNPSACALQHICEMIRNRSEDRSSGRAITEPSVEQLRQAKAFFNRLFFDEKSYDLGEVGRYRLTTRMHLDFIVELLLQVVAKNSSSSSTGKLDLKQLKASVLQCAELEERLQAGEEIGVELAHARDERAAQIDKFIDYLARFSTAVNADNQDRLTFEPQQELIDQFFYGPLLTHLRQQAEKEGRQFNDALAAQILPSGVIRSLLATLPHDRELVTGLIDSIYLERTPVLQRTLTRVDLVMIIGHMVALANGFEEVLAKFDADARIRMSIDSFADAIGSRPVVLDDIDHLGNRRVRSVGELLFAEVSRGLSKMARTIRDRLSHPDDDWKSPKDLINARAVSAAVQTFFGSSQLSQFMDQNNPLAELTNKRRMSALGPGGITRDRAGFEVRDVHYTHYGRLCPIETPEGPNIGLINSLASYARVNPFGFIETPYRKVSKGKVSNDVVYLTADQEDNYKIASAATQLDEKGNILEEYVLVRMKGDFPVVPKATVELMDVVPKQIVSIAAGLIPFLEHNDANRALMGSNMQRQAVPLLRSSAPIVGTGLEAPAAHDSGALVISQSAGEVVYVDAEQIKVKRREQAAEDLISLGDVDIDVYNLRKFERSNQDTCINQKPIVKVGDRVEVGTILADGASTEMGELALGQNIRIAFLPWNGYNFEDAIIISEQICADDVFTSIHIEEFTVEVRETKRGPEELTREIPNVSAEAINDLDENGIIRVGAEVVDGDIMVGKITPKGELELGPELRLLRAIFAEKANDVSDTSLKAPPGMKGVVVETRVFTRKERSDAATKKADAAKVEAVRKEAATQIRSVEKIRNEKLSAVLLGATTVNVVNATVGDQLIAKGKKYTERMIETLGNSIADVKENIDLCNDAALNSRAWKIIIAAKRQIKLLEERAARQVDRIAHGDELKPGVLKMVKVYVAKKRQLSVGDKMAGRHGNKGVVSKIVPVEDMPFTEDGEPIQILLNPLGVPSRMNVGQVLEVHLGWAAKALGIKVSTPVFEGATYEDVIEALGEANLPKSGKTHLIDGRSGEYFHTPVVVGYMYMLKLHHLVDEKMHARAIGHYALVTQQPLGGKSQFGGQRFGEMEVWALQAYGAAYTLQELLTIKSDDVVGRNKAYEAIVKDETLPEPGMPESFNVLIKEIQALGLNIKVGG